MKVRWIDAGKVGPLRSQSIYHGLGRAFKDESLNSIIWSVPTQPYMCIGHFQNPKNELNLKYCQEHNLPVIRRKTGGGAVLINEGQIFVQWVFNSEYISPKVDRKFQLFIEPMVETYKHFGIDAYGYKNHDVHVKGKKIVGTGAARIGRAEVITGNFIVDFDSNQMSNVLNLPDDIMRNQVRRKLDEYMTSMTTELDKAPDFDEIRVVYKKKCEEIHGLRFQEIELTDHEMYHIEKEEQLLSDPDWTYSMNQATGPIRLIKIHSGVWVGQKSLQKGHDLIHFTLSFNEDLINFLHIDFEEGKRPVQARKVEKKLLNTSLNSEEITNTLLHCGDISWSQLSVKEWVDTLMSIKAEQVKISGDG